ncbi:hypothetical protein MOQ72_13135 [Saccharopolyspora sp. K220]|uniref:hypothetical protein n=1 Tax=Saccharopolyspora soli TaxID=2926618 RepID=UPI001F59D00A|nr:hypothetical protein [Saccharopolyspora soli]MCI2418375.1 hypothetical protein [Saccharopolyspora soli]
MPKRSRSLSVAELADQRVEFLPARTVMSTMWLPWNGDDVVVLHDTPNWDDHPHPADHHDVTTGDITGGSGGTGGGSGGGQGGGNGGNGGDGGDGGDGGNGGDGGDGIGGNGIGGAGIGGDGGGTVH